MSIAGRRILVASADAALSDAIAEQLRLERSTEALCCDSLASALASLGTAAVSAVIADDGLPDATARDLHRALRLTGVTVPIIALVAPGGEADGEGMEPVVKPFRLGALVARLEDLVERAERRLPDTVVIGPFDFRSGSGLLVHRSSGEERRLTDKEAGILGELIRAGGAVVARDVLLARIWGYRAGVETRTLETHVWRLRRKIEGDRSGSHILVTAPGGYRLET